MLMYQDVFAVLPTGYDKSLAFQAYVMARGQQNIQRHKRFHQFAHLRTVLQGTTPTIPF